MTVHLHYSTIFSGCRQSMLKSYFYRYSSTWRPRLNHNACSLLANFHSRHYSTPTRKRGSKKTSGSQESKLDNDWVEDPDKDTSFYLVRKGDLLGVYRNSSYCQAQMGSTIFDPPVSVFKGHGLSKEAEQYLASCGLKNATYTIRATDLKDGIFGRLVHCPLQNPTSSIGEESNKDASKKTSEDIVSWENPASSIGEESSKDASKKRHQKVIESREDLSSGKTIGSAKKCEGLYYFNKTNRSCTMKFDGASKGNPGEAGAGAVLRADDGSLICRLSEGVGIATCNVAEYRGIILGLKYAVEKGYDTIRVQGDSKLVCWQVQGRWKVKNQKLLVLYKEVTKLKNKFISFQISHVLRDLNSEADVQANLAVCLPDGEVLEESQICS